LSNAVARPIVYLGHIAGTPRTGGEFHISQVLRGLSDEGHCVRTFGGCGTGAIRTLLLDPASYFATFVRTPALNGAVVLEPYARRFSLVGLNPLLRAATDVKMVGLVHAFYFPYRRSWMKNVVDRLVSRAFLAPMDLIVTGGEACARELRGLGVDPTKIRVVYPALRAEFRDCVPLGDETRRPHRPVRILCIGRSHKVKGLEVLLDAVATVRERVPMSLTIVGDMSQDAAYYQTLLARIREYGIERIVEFTGRIEGLNRLIAIYRSADIFVLPSLWETSPVCVLEAMCLALPVVATNVGGIPDYLGDAGLLVPAGDPAALSAAILALTFDDSMRRRASVKSLERSDLFRSRTWGDVAREYAEILEGSDLYHDGPWPEPR
jgi:glycosyltransferase involved in cell wall biosynthesis